VDRRARSTQNRPRKPEGLGLDRSPQYEPDVARENNQGASRLARSRSRFSDGPRRLRGTESSPARAKRVRATDPDSPRSSRGRRIDEDSRVGARTTACEPSSGGDRDRRGGSDLAVRRTAPRPRYDARSKPASSTPVGPRDAPVSGSVHGPGGLLRITRSRSAGKWLARAVGRRSRARSGRRRQRNAAPDLARGDRRSGGLGPRPAHKREDRAHGARHRKRGRDHEQRGGGSTGDRDGYEPLERLPYGARTRHIRTRPYPDDQRPQPEER
jgi:hypothetical protein